MSWLIKRYFCSVPAWSLRLPRQQAAAQLGPPPDGAKALSSAYTGKTYSPYAERGFPARPLWGDTHLHTSLSFDAGAFGNTLGLREAYQFARGDQIRASKGLPVKLSRPLDWLVIADHSDNMGFITDLYAGKAHLLADPQGKEWYDRILAGEGVGVALDIIKLFSQGKFPETLAYTPDSKPYRTAWQDTVAAAEEYNDPGTFTAFIGNEWTSLAKGNNLHRVVIFRDNGDKALQIAPYTTTAPQGSTDPLDLYKWMETYEKKTGGDILALAHNGNLANGIMFPIDAQYTGRKLDKRYVTERAKWEPLYEATQIKGDGEAHPFLSPNDEFADYENWDVGNLDLSASKDQRYAGRGICPRRSQAWPCSRSQTGDQPVQVRHGGLDGQPYLSGNCSGRQFLRQAFRVRA